MHFLLLRLSSEKLIQNNLYIEEKLFEGSNDPDTRQSLDHERLFKVKQSMCAAVVRVLR